MARALDTLIVAGSDSFCWTMFPNKKHGGRLQGAPTTSDSASDIDYAARAPNTGSTGAASSTDRTFTERSQILSNAIDRYSAHADLAEEYTMSSSGKLEFRQIGYDAGMAPANVASSTGDAAAAAPSAPAPSNFLVRPRGTAALVLLAPPAPLAPQLACPSTGVYVTAAFTDASVTGESSTGVTAASVTDAAGKGTAGTVSMAAGKGSTGTVAACKGSAVNVSKAALRIRLQPKVMSKSMPKKRLRSQDVVDVDDASSETWFSSDMSNLD